MVCKMQVDLGGPSCGKQLYENLLSMYSQAADKLQADTMSADEREMWNSAFAITADAITDYGDYEFDFSNVSSSQLASAFDLSSLAIRDRSDSCADYYFGSDGSVVAASSSSTRSRAFIGVAALLAYYA
jgi:hypothetical protein